MVGLHVENTAYDTFLDGVSVGRIAASMIMAIRHLKRRDGHKADAIDHRQRENNSYGYRMPVVFLLSLSGDTGERGSCHTGYQTMLFFLLKSAQSAAPLELVRVLVFRLFVLVSSILFVVHYGNHVRNVGIPRTSRSDEGVFVHKKARRFFSCSRPCVWHYVIFFETYLCRALIFLEGRKAYHDLELGL